MKECFPSRQPPVSVDCKRKSPIPMIAWVPGFSLLLRINSKSEHCPDLDNVRILLFWWSWALQIRTIYII